MMQSKQRRKVAKAAGGWQMSCTARCGKLDLEKGGWYGY